MLKRLWKTLRPIAIIYVGVMLVLMLLETSLIYPAPAGDDGDWQPSWLEYEDVYFTSADGTSLHGWYSPTPNADMTILFSHGNGEHVAYLADELEYLRDKYHANVMVYDYRGYGKSEGRPFEAGVLADGEAAQRWLAQRTQQPAGQIVLWGRSLGGAVATHLAAKLGARALILDRTFSSMVDVAASKFPWLPVRWMIRNRYPSTVAIANYSGPLLQFHGRPDRVVPFRFAQKLFDACPSTQKRFIVSEHLGHNTPWPDEFYDTVAEFLEAANGGS